MTCPETRRSRLRGDDGVALVMALGVIVVFTALMLTMLAVVLRQVTPAAQARKDTGSLNSAASGLQAGLAVLRSATTTDGAGERGRLCTTPAAVVFRSGGEVGTTLGTVVSASASPLPGAFRYDVHIAFYRSDPRGRSVAWLQDPANVLPCPLLETPLYAYLQSYATGDNTAGAGGPTGTRGNRSQTGVYRFSVPAENVAGGRLRSFGTELCLDAGSSPRPGSVPAMQPCADRGTPAQVWEYRADLTLFYGGAPGLNLCVQAAWGVTPTLQRCTGTGYGETYDRTYGYATPAQQQQEWSFNDNGHFASAADNGDITGVCLQPVTSGPGQQLKVYDCTGSTDDFRAFDPDPEVGAGKAGGNTEGKPGSPTRQYVNFKEFGRCLDITGQQVTATFLIAYPCKQAPDSTRLTYNQVWEWQDVGNSGTGTMRTRTPANDGKGGRPDTDYCLTAPAGGVLVTVSECQGNRADQRWEATGDVPGSPETSYHLVSRSRRLCLAVGGTRTGYGSSQIVLAGCADDPAQRWNAPPPLPPAGLDDVQEGGTAR